MTVSTTVTRTATDQAVGFLRYRCSMLQSALYNDSPRAQLLADEPNAAATWLGLLGVVEDPAVRESLTGLYELHGRIMGRLERGGVADLSVDVEELVRACLVERLQALTDTAVVALST